MKIFFKLQAQYRRQTCDMRERGKKMNIRNEKLKKLISGLTAGMGCMAVAGVLFWAAPMEVKAVPIASGTGVVGNENTNNGDANNENTDGDNAAPEENASEQASGGTVTSVTVTAGNVNVRSDASTSASKAGTASNGTEMTVTGEKADSSGMTWYAVTYESNGSTVSGYIRSDLVEAHVTAPVEAEPEAPAEEEPADTPEEPVVTNDYFVQYEDDGTGSGVNAWYLYDSIRGTKYKIDNLLNAEETNQSNEKLMEEQTGKLKMIIVALAAVILILIIVLTVLILKLRNSSYDDDDYDDEDDEEEDEDEEEEEEYRPRRSAKTARSQSDKNWQSKNFLDDDDLEFEFLDLK